VGESVCGCGCGCGCIVICVRDVCMRANVCACLSASVHQSNCKCGIFLIGAV
jgi:hypothetical protein